MFPCFKVCDRLWFPLSLHWWVLWTSSLEGVLFGEGMKCNYKIERTYLVSSTNCMNFFYKQQLHSNSSLWIMMAWSCRSGWRSNLLLLKWKFFKIVATLYQRKVPQGVLFGGGILMIKLHQIINIFNFIVKINGLMTSWWVYRYWKMVKENDLCIFKQIFV